MTSKCTALILDDLIVINQILKIFSASGDCSLHSAETLKEGLPHVINTYRHILYGY